MITTNLNQTPPGRRHRRTTSAVAAFTALSFLAAACGSDKAASPATTAAPAATTAASTAGSTADTTAASTADTTAASTADTTGDTTAASTGDTTAASTGDTTADSTAGSTADTGATTPFDLDTNGDGKVVIGVATPGPRNDGAYYQALVDGVTAFSKAHNFADPIIVDNIKAEEAASQLDALARQNVDMIAVGAGEIGDPLADLTVKYPKIVWYCNCGAGHDALPNLIQSGDDGSEMGYSAGVATGLLMQAKGVTKAAMIGNNNFNFEIEAFESF
ncbi:MAG: hypothetical protein JWN39_414, partial [Ilumatobacteraceae bacterium]|nr:hypothetical protein [Ilumatobacteraceae bacterium]